MLWANPWLIPSQGCLGTHLELSQSFSKGRWHHSHFHAQKSWVITGKNGIQGCLLDLFFFLGCFIFLHWGGLFLLCEFPSIKWSVYYGHGAALLFFRILTEEYQKITTHQPAELPQIAKFGLLMWFLLWMSWWVSAPWDSWSCFQSLVKKTSIWTQKTPKYSVWSLCCHFWSFK